ncbi:Efflux transporter periplasmic adaptor subunit [Hyella patelloides LEGE 07179]|uniref:Efflux transporter periplasmic adaptor subunit n=1 Tax=Hyella patelloides LEGE 07179 TaxID=945734 RepID=A0A563VMD0_9CYAN|nr:efflux RND transporter periplasmic adaptor subunit [Hyella patelloides]VEP12517.1 Efflux transporter periplasmic adaptor subunit [Hyella patelloides LEGE 07179]
MKSLSLKKTKILIPWIGGLVLVGIGTIATLDYLETKDNNAEELITSQTVLVKSQDLAVQIQANGTVQALRTTNLSPEAPGRIVELYIREGDRIERGQVIALMESDRLQAQIDRYKAALQKAQANLARIIAGNRPEFIAAAEARVKTAQANVAVAQTRLQRTQEETQRNQLLVEQGAISRNAFNDFATKEAEAQASLEAELARLAEQQENLAEAQQGSRLEEIAQAEAEVAEAQAELASIQIQLDKTTVRAPFGGIITRRYAEAGDYVDSTTAASETEGATSTSIGELSSGLEIEAKIPEASIAQIKLGQPVDIKVDAYSQETFKGEVRLIAPRAIKEENVTSFRVKVALKTGQEKLKSGMNTRLTFTDELIQDTLTIPLATVVTKPNGETGVYVADSQGKAQFQAIKLGTASGDRTQVLSGLTQGDRVFTSPPPDVTIEGVDTVNFD